ncbi:MAG: M20 family metallopeptidase [Hungatella hathewayi]|uniref:M20 family metallopeptidase n=1 Tax=Hungatella TaxID=1649459 RepID=UPI001105E6D4|nr:MULTISPECIES: M20 family metallopeptidase [Hungatella]MCI7383824.1 M20 family metallopeptidase [Hungatella sp.]MDY6236222.1 M20 family metallopeptidase [Hungatella hathewayi]
MDNHNSDAMELTMKLVRIDSTDPGACEGEIGTFIFQYLKDLGVPVIKKEVLPGRFNIMAKVEGKEDAPALVYICHMDTVTTGEGWTVSPFGAEVIRGRIYGRGACDMKSGLACALSAFTSMALKARNGKKPGRSLVFIGTVDEEDFMRGAEAAIADGWVSKDSWVLDTEPTNGQIEVAHKGRTWFEITVNGITAHASTPWKGADAIAAMAEIIAAIRRRIAACPVHPDLGASTVTFGQIEGGYRPYVVPDSCRVWIDMRLVPPTDTAGAAAIVEDAIAAAIKEIPGVSAAYQITGNRPYVEKDEQSPLLNALSRACEEVTGEPAPVSFFPGYTDTAVIAGTLGNHNCMSYGPGDLELAHKPDEYVPCEDILRCEEVLTRLADNLLF